MCRSEVRETLVILPDFVFLTKDLLCSMLRRGQPSRVPNALPPVLRSRKDGGGKPLHSFHSRTDESRRSYPRRRRWRRGGGGFRKIEAAEVELELLSRLMNGQRDGASSISLSAFRRQRCTGIQEGGGPIRFDRSTTGSIGGTSRDVRAARRHPLSRRRTRYILGSFLFWPQKRI